MDDEVEVKGDYQNERRSDVITPFTLSLSCWRVAV